MNTRGTPLPKASILRSPLSAKTRSATAGVANGGNFGPATPSTLNTNQARGADFLDRQLSLDEERHRQQQQQHKMQQQQQQQAGNE